MEKITKKEKFFYLFLIIYVILSIFIPIHTYKQGFRDAIIETKTENIIVSRCNNIERKNATSYEPFEVPFYYEFVPLGTSATHNYYGNFNITLYVDEEMDLYQSRVDYSVYSMNLLTFEFNQLYDDRIVLEYDYDIYDDLPNIILVNDLDFSISLQQYQDTGYHSVHIDQFYFDIYENGFEYQSYGILYEYNENLRPFQTSSFVTENSLEYLSNLTSVVTDYSYQLGFADGRDYGYEEGINAGDTTHTAYNFIWGMITNATNSVLNVLNIQLFGGIPLYSIVAIPLIISIFMFILKVIKK